MIKIEEIPIAAKVIGALFPLIIGGVSVFLYLQSLDRNMKNFQTELHRSFANMETELRRSFSDLNKKMNDFNHQVDASVNGMVHRNERVIERIDAAIARVDKAYDDEVARDAGWLAKDTDEHIEIMESFASLNADLVKLKADIIDFISTGRDDEAFQRGVHEGYHESERALLDRIDGFLMELQRRDNYIHGTN